jgi:hypothetical protein
MRVRSFLLSALAAAGGAGCGGGGGNAPGPAPLPAIVGLSPTAAWRGDAVTLTITGTDTGWSAASLPYFEPGTGLAVDALTVVSPTELRASVRVLYDAPVGPRVIYVGTGTTYRATPEFRVDAPITVAWFAQPFVQASVLVGVLGVNRPGDVIDGRVLATARDGSPLPLWYDDPAGFILVLPEDVPLGVFDLAVHRTGAGGGSTLKLPGGPIGTRASVLTSFPLQMTLPTADGTALHRITTTTDGFLEFPMTSSDPTLPIHFLYAHASPFAPPVVGNAPILYGGGTPGPRAVVRAGETYDLVVFSGHTSYGIDVRETPVAPVAETEPNDVAASAQALSPPALVTPAAMVPETGVDWFTFTASAADVGKVLRVVTSPGPALSVVIARADLATTLGGASAAGPGAAVDLRSTPLPAAEKVYVRVTSGATPAKPDVTPSYRLFLRLESP